MQRGFGALVFELLSIETQEHQAQKQRGAAGGQHYRPQQSVAQMGGALGHGARILQAIAFGSGAAGLPRRARRRLPARTSGTRHECDRYRRHLPLALRTQAGLDFLPARSRLAQVCRDKVAHLL